jgi:hypothetical protein
MSLPRLLPVPKPVVTWPVEHSCAVRERARRTVDAAQTAIDRAYFLSTTAKSLAADCHRWRDLWATQQAAPETVLVCCAYCQRVRACDGAWLATASRTRNGLQRRGASLSHGLCPECVSEHYSAFAPFLVSSR